MKKKTYLHNLINQISSGSSGRVRGDEKHETYAAAFGGHLFYDLFSQGRGGPWPPPWIRYCKFDTMIDLERHVTETKELQSECQGSVFQVDDELQVVHAVKV